MLPEKLVGPLETSGKMTGPATPEAPSWMCAATIGAVRPVALTLYWIRRAPVSVNSPTPIPGLALGGASFAPVA